MLLVLIRILTAAPLRVRRHHRPGRPGGAGGAGGCPGGVHVGLLLRLHDVLLVADPLVTKPVTDLRHGDAALSGQLLLGLLTWVGVGKVRVEIFIENLGGLFGEVTSLSALI